MTKADVTLLEIYDEVFSVCVMYLLVPRQGVANGHRIQIVAFLGHLLAAIARICKQTTLIV